MTLPGHRAARLPDMPGYGESPMLAATPAVAGDYADAPGANAGPRWSREQTILVGHSLGALVAAAFAANTAEGALPVLADVAQGYGVRRPQREKSGRDVNSR